LAHRYTQLDGHNKAAFVATTGTRGRIIGVARYSRRSPTCAEVAFVVEDTYQHHRIGSRLIQQLVQTARDNGITEFVADVLVGNTPALRLLRNLGPTWSHFELGVCQVHVDLTQAAAFFLQGFRDVRPRGHQR
jgi:acetyltransferase